MGSAATVEDILATTPGEAAAEPERAADAAVDTEEDIVNVNVLLLGNLRALSLPVEAKPR